MTTLQYKHLSFRAFVACLASIRMLSMDKFVCAFNDAVSILAIEDPSLPFEPDMVDYDVVNQVVLNYATDGASTR